MPTRSAVVDPWGPAAAAAARARASADKRQQQAAQQPAAQHRTPVRAADSPAAGSGRKRARPAAAGTAPAAQALPHVHLRPTGNWEVRLGFRHAEGGPGNPNVGTFESQDEAAVARSLALAFHQHSQGAPLSTAKPKLLHTLASLQNQKATLREVRACSDWQSMRDLLQQWKASGKLRRLATSLVLATAAAEATAPAAAAAEAPAAALRKRRALGRQPRARVEGASTDEGSAQRGVAGSAVRTPAQAARRHGAEAVGRRVRVWLRLDEEVEHQHDGCIAEYTPTGKHHVVYEDGEEGLVDLATAQFRFLPPAASRAAAAAEAPETSAAAAAPPLEFTSPADVGEELFVWWSNDRLWYEGVVTHVLRNGMLCVRYKLDNMELLVDAAESKVHWASPARRKRHERLLKRQAHQRKAAKEAERAARRAQQQRQRQGEQRQRQDQQQLEGAGSQGAGGSRPIKAEPAAEEPAPPPPPPASTAAAAVGAGTSAAAAAAGGAPEADMFDFMMDCAELPEAGAAGFTQELACSFQSLLDMLPPRDRATKEARLRGQLEQRKFSNAAALARMALDLALAGRAAQAPA